MRLTVDERQLEKIVKELRRRKDVADLNRLKQHGVAFTVTIQARSNVRLTVRTVQSSRRPGGVATVMAALTDFGIPLASSAKVTASVHEIC